MIEKKPIKSQGRVKILLNHRSDIRLAMTDFLHFE